MPIVEEKTEQVNIDDFNSLQSSFSDLNRRFGFHNHDGSNSLRVAISSLRGPVILGGILQSITSQDDIQTAIDYVNANGGGTVFLKNGTYTVSKNLTMYSNITIQGQSGSSTIIDFGSGAYNFSLVGSSVYSAGTIASISFGVNVVGSNTNWTGAMSQQQIFINNRWYPIATVLGATSMTLASGYADGATFTGNYRISSVVKNCGFKDLTIQKSTTTVISGTDVRDLFIEDVALISNNIGLSLTNFYQINTNRVLDASSTSDGIQLTNGAFFNAYNTAAVSSGGNNWTLNNIKSCTFIFSAGDSATGGDGVNATSVTNSAFKMECSSNSGKGIQFVSGCNGNLVDDELVNANTSDGIKLAASSSNNTFIAMDVTNNGGYGINIAASSCNDNIVTTPYIFNNTSGSINDLGTRTLFLFHASDTYSRLQVKNGTSGNGTLFELSNDLGNRLLMAMYGSAIGVNVFGTSLNNGIFIGQEDNVSSPLLFGFSNGSATGSIYIGTKNTQAMQIDSNQNIVLGPTGALATTATDGFIYIPTSAGAPTGAPTAFTGKVAMEYDTTNNKLYIRNGAAWKSGAFT